MAPPNPQWPNNKKCAVSLTYDDGLPVHRQLVAETLEANGLRGTFYVQIRSADLRANPSAWRQLAGRGHELGNHSLFHPCRRKPDNTWLAPHYDLKHYNLDRWRDELEVASFALELIDGKTKRSYGNNCCNTTLGEEPDEVSMDPVLADLFVAARGPFNEQICVPDQNFNPMQIGHYSGDFQSFEQLQEKIQQALTLGGWIVFMIHGVGKDTHGLFIDPEQHQKLAHWLGENQQEIWTAPFVEVAEHLLNPV